MRNPNLTWMALLVVAGTGAAAGMALAGPAGVSISGIDVPISPMELMIRRRQNTELLRTADKLFAAEGDNPEAHAIQGIVYSIQGWPSESVLAFELAAGGDNYESSGLHYHAGALRDLGRGQEAAQLRREQRLVPSSNRFEHVSIEANIVDDLRAVEAWDDAIEAADVLLETVPGNVIAHSTVADLMWSMGEVDEAMFQMFLGARTGTRSYRYLEVLAHMAVDEGRLDEAAQHLAQARKQRPRLPRIRSLQLQVSCELGEEEQLLEELSYPRFRGHMDPGLLISEAECRARRGEYDQARVLLDDLRAMYPELPHARAAVARIEATLPSR